MFDLWGWVWIVYRFGGVVSWVGMMMVMMGCVYD